MSFWTRFREPKRSDYDTEEEYQEALKAYEYAEYWAIEGED